MSTNEAARPTGEFRADLPWRRSGSVAIRPERFGALAYHFGNRKLSFLKSPILVRVVESLADHDSALSTLRACDVPEQSQRTYLRALADLARSQLIEPRSAS